MTRLTTYEEIRYNVKTSGEFYYTVLYIIEKKKRTCLRSISDKPACARITGRNPNAVVFIAIIAEKTGERELL